MSIAQTNRKVHGLSRSVHGHPWRPGEQALWKARLARIDETQAEVETLMSTHTKACEAIRDYPGPSDWALARGTDCQEYREWSAELDRLAEQAKAISTKLKTKIAQLDYLMSYAFERIDMESPNDPPPGEGKDAPIQGETQDF